MVQIFTDTAANLPMKLLEEYGIRTVPLSYEVDGVEPDYSIEFNGPAFYAVSYTHLDVYKRQGQALRLGVINKAFEPFEQQLAADTVWARIPEKADRAQLFGD